MPSNNLNENEWQQYYAEHINPDYPVGVYYINPTGMIMGRIPHHWHNAIEIDFIRTGSASFSIGEKKLTLSEGEAIIINTGRIHSISSNGEKECIVLSILFSPDYIFENPSSFISHKYREPIMNDTVFSFRYFSKKDKAGLECIESLLKINLDKKYGYELMTKSLLCHLWLLLIEDNRIDSISTLCLNDEARVKGAISYINTNYMNEITLEGIAESIHISKSECCRCFKRVTGMTPFEYLMRQRILESTAKIQRNDPDSASYAMLAKSVGFNNASYFNKIFKKYMGDTPSNCRDFIRKSHRDSLSPFGISLSKM